MDPDGNPYCSVQNIELSGITECENFSENILPDYGSSDNLWMVASGWKRLANYFIDLIFIYLMIIVFSAELGVFALVTQTDISWVERESDVVGFLIGIFVIFLYYGFFESLFSASIGKFITGTRVITNEGGKPGLKTVLGRTLSRCIPFEFLTFLKKNPIGMHDHLADTIVIDIKKQRLQSSEMDDITGSH
jgi:uncharacterized RDD family membrane protein YckC